MVETIEDERIPKQLQGRDIIFFDGSCVMCHGFVKTVLRLDTDKHFLLCSQQSELAHAVLERHGVNADDLSTVYVVRDCGTENERVLIRSTAVAYVFASTRGGGVLGKLLYLIPSPLRDFGYKIVAKIRYRIFGKTNEACRVPTPEDRARIIG